MIEIFEAVVLGTLFGFALQKAGLTRYDRIVGVYRLRDFTVMQFMLSALVVAASLNQAFAALGLAKAPPTPPTFVLANVVGGVVFGIGMASAGYCPGTIVAEAGEGRLDAWVAGLAGMLVGAIAFGLMQPWLMPRLTRTLALGRIGLATLAGTSPWLTLLVFGELVALVLYLIARSRRPGRADRAGSARGPHGHAPA
jgi:hypothetical protein